MAESTLSQSLFDLQAEVGYALGYTRGPWSDTNNIADIESCISSGVRQFFFPPPPFAVHRWNFFRPVTTLTTSAPYSTGTVTVVSGVVTLASGTFPSWSASGVFVYSNAAYEISTRDSDTQITLVDTSLSVSAGATYEVNQQDYDLPADFGHLNGDITFVPETAWPAIRIVSDSMIRSMRQAAVQVARPLYAAIRPKTATLTTGQRWEIMFYPTPDAAYIKTYPYQPLPGKLTATNLYTYGGMAHAETILESCLAVAETRMNDTQGIHRQLFMERLAASVEFDKRLSPTLMGYNGDRSMGQIRDRRGVYQPLNGLATYAGSTWQS